MVEIRLISLPTERYKRNVVRGKLDLVGKNLCYPFFCVKNYFCTKLVSIGGTAGLFVGGSLLSFAEIMYYLLLRSLGAMCHRPKIQ